MERVLIVVRHRKGKTKRFTIPLDGPVKIWKKEKVTFNSWTDEGSNLFSITGKVDAVEEYWELRPAYSVPENADKHTHH